MPIRATRLASLARTERRAIARLAKPCDMLDHFVPNWTARQADTTRDTPIRATCRAEQEHAILDHVTCHARTQLALYGPSDQLGQSTALPATRLTHAHLTTRPADRHAKTPPSSPFQATRLACTGLATRRTGATRTSICRATSRGAAYLPTTYQATGLDETNSPCQKTCKTTTGSGALHRMTCLASPTRSVPGDMPPRARHRHAGRHTGPVPAERLAQPSTPLDVPGDMLNRILSILATCLAATNQASGEP